MRRVLLTAVLIMLGTMGAAHATRAAVLSFSPSEGTYRVGQMVNVNVELDAKGTSINAANGTIAFPKNLLRLNSVSQSGSIFSVWTASPVGSNLRGQIDFSGGLPDPEFSGSDGLIVGLQFQVLAPGTAVLEFTQASTLANDGAGTQVLTSSTNANFFLTRTESVAPPVTLVPPHLSSETHSDESRWYHQSTAIMTYTQPTGLLGVSYSISDDPMTVPDTTPDPADGSFTVTMPHDGVWYVHIRGQYDGGWSETDHFALRVDGTPPEPFSLDIRRDRGASDPTPTIRFRTTDEGSGLHGYSLTYNGQDNGMVTSPLTLPIISRGHQRVEITAVDEAGNLRSSVAEFDMLRVPPPTINLRDSSLILLEPVHIEGLATAGTTVKVFIDGIEAGLVHIGAVTASQDEIVTIRLPWSFDSTAILRPGKHLITASATQPDGQVSELTDPLAVRVSGWSVQLGGRTIATVAAGTVGATIFVLLFGLLVLTMGKSWWSLMALHRREVVVAGEIKQLATALKQRPVTVGEVSSSLDRIESDLQPNPKRRRRSTRSRTTPSA